MGAVRCTYPSALNRYSCLVDDEEYPWCCRLEAPPHSNSRCRRRMYDDGDIAESRASSSPPRGENRDPAPHATPGEEAATSPGAVATQPLADVVWYEAILVDVVVVVVVDDDDEDDDEDRPSNPLWPRVTLTEALADHGDAESSVEKGSRRAAAPGEEAAEPTSVYAALLAWWWAEGGHAGAAAGKSLPIPTAAEEAAAPPPGAGDGPGWWPRADG